MTSNTLTVLIESDWNLKQGGLDGIKSDRYVLIESDWNLKWTHYNKVLEKGQVLIESDWNLKKNITVNEEAKTVGINRIRLEFKDHMILHLQHKHCLY